MKGLRKTSGFSLAEVALAMGILAFAFTGLLALFSTALNNGAMSRQDSVLALLANTVMDDLRRQHFVDGAHADGSPGVLPGTAPTADPAPAAVNLPTIYFDEAGVRLLDANGADLTANAAITAGALYQCICSVQATAAPGTMSQGPWTVNHLSVTLTFGWPVLPGASTSSNLPPNVRAIRTSIARY